MTLLIKALNVKPCGCSDCDMAHKVQIHDGLTSTNQESQKNLVNGLRVGVGMDNQHEVVTMRLIMISDTS